MKKFWLVGLIIAAMAVPELLQAQVEVGSGTLQIGGKVKWAYVYKAESEDAVGAAADGQVSGFDGAAIEQFATANVELDINGTVGEKVAYVIELQASNSASALVGDTSGNIWWKSGPGELGPIGVRQAKIMFKDVIPMTTVTVGTFNLPVSIYQPRATNDYDLIMLPLINQVQFGNPAALYAPLGLGWQATGVNFAIAPADMIELDVAYFNGNAAGRPNLDIDLEKSWLVNLKVMPAEGAMISIAYLTEGWQEDTTVNFNTGTQEQNAAGWVVSGAYDNKKLEANFDYMTMTAKDYQFYSNKQQNLTWMGYQVTVGYWITDAIEALVRYENVDPNTANTKKTWNGPMGYPSEYDALSILTLGANYRITENSEVSVNYLWITEQGDDINMTKANRMPSSDRGKYQKLDNDTLLIQVQVWQ